MKTFHRRRSVLAIVTWVTVTHLVIQPLAWADVLYWDANSTTAGAGAQPDGIWGTSVFWNTDATGGAGTLGSTATSGDLLYFVAGPAADSGNTAYAVTVSDAQVGAGLVFQASGAATFSGGTSVSLGASGITIPPYAYDTTDNGAVTMDTAITLASAQTWVNNSVNALTINANISNGANLLGVDGTGKTTLAGTLGSGAGGLTKTGSGTLTLSNANTFTGALTAAGGTVVGTANAGALGLGALTLAGGALKLTNTSGSNLDFGRNTTVSSYTTITSDLDASGAGNTYTLGTLAIGAQQLNIVKGVNVASGTAGVTFSGTTTLSASGTTFDVGAGANLTLGVIAGAMSIFKQGAGTLTLSGASTRAGSTTYVLSPCTALHTAAAGLGTAAATYVLSGGPTIDLAVDTPVNAHPVTLWGNATILSDKATPASAGTTHTLGTLTSLGANTLTIDKGANVGSGTATVAFGVATINADTTFSIGSNARLTLNSTLSNGAFTPTFTGAGDATVTGVISGGGGLVINVGGTMTLTAANTFTGPVSIGSGTVTIGNATALGPAATAVVNMTGGTLNLAALSPTLLALSGNASSGISSTGAGTLTITPLANNTSNFAGVIGGGGGTLAVTLNSALFGTLTLSGANTYSGITTLTAGRLNVNNNSALGTSALATALTITTGIIDNTSGGAVTLTANTPVTLNGNFSFGGSGDLSFGSGTLLNAATPKTLNLLGTSGKTLTFGTWNNNVASAVTTVYAMPGVNSSLSIGTFRSTSTATAGTIAGNGNITISNGIQPGTAAGASIVYSNAGTLTLTGTSTYTGATTFNGGTVILDASSVAAALNSATAPTFAGGTFIFKGDGSGTRQQLGNLTLAAGGRSSIQVVGGAAGSELRLGTFTLSANNGAMDISVSGTSPQVTTTTTSAGWANGTGARGAVTFTSGGTTSFATLTTAVANNPFSGLTIANALPASGAGSTINYIWNTGGIAAVTTSEQGNALQINNTSGSSQTLTINSTIVLTLTSGGLLNTSTDPFVIAGPGSIRSLTATASDLIIHNYGAALEIGAVIPNGTGTSVLTLVGPGTTTLSGANTYTGVTLAGGGATVVISANNNLGGTATAGLTLNNATLRTTATFSSARPITLGVDGGTLDVGSGTILTLTAATGGTGSLTKKGAGTLLRTTVVSTYTGGFTYIQDGTLQVGFLNALPTSTIVVLGSGSNSGVLTLGTAAATFAQTVAGLMTSGTGTGNAVVGGNAANSTLTFTGSLLTPSVFAGTLGGTGANQNNLALSVTAGALTLSGANTYAGGTTLSGGVMNINNGGSGGTSSAIGTGTLNITGGAIDNTSGGTVTVSTANAVTLGGNFTFGGSCALDFDNSTASPNASGRTLTLGGTAALRFNALNFPAAAYTLTVNSAGGINGPVLNIGTLDLNTGVSGTATILTGNGNVNITTLLKATAASTPFTYNGTGILTIDGTATYGGLTTIGGVGRVVLGTNGNLPSGNNLTMTAGMLDLNGRNQTVGTLTLTAPALITSGGALCTLTANNVAASTGHLAGNLHGDFTLTGAAANMSGTYNNTGNLTFRNLGAGALTVSGNVLNSGNLTFVANNAQAFTVSASRVNPASGTIANTGAGTGTTTMSGIVGPDVTTINNTGASPLTISGVVRLNPAGLTLTQSGTGLVTWGAAAIVGAGDVNVVDNSTGNITFTAVPSFAGNLAFQTGSSGAITASGAINNAGTVTVSGGGFATTILSGVIGPSVTGVIHDSATLMLALNGANTYRGPTTINAGIVRLGNATALGAAGNASVVFGPASRGQLQLNGNSVTIVSLAAADATNFIENIHATTAVTLTVNATGLSTFSGVLQNGGAAALALIKGGAGTLTIGGPVANTYSGTTTISAGTLQVTGGLAIANANLVTLGTTAANTFEVLASETIGALSGGNASYGITVIAPSQVLTVANGTQTYSGKFSGSGKLVVAGAVQTLAGDSSATWTGDTEITGGTLKISAENQLGAAASGLLVNGGILDVTAGFTASAAKVLTIGAAGGTVQVDAGTLGLLSAGQLAGTGSFTKTGAGTLRLGGANTRSGSVYINAGYLRADDAQALGSGPVAVYFGGGTLQTRTDSDAVFPFNFDALSGNGTVDVGQLSGSTQKKHTFGDAALGSGRTLTFSGLNGHYATVGDVSNAGTLTMGYNTEWRGLYITGTYSGAGEIASNRGSVLLNDANVLSGEGGVHFANGNYNTLSYLRGSMPKGPTLFVENGSTVYIPSVSGAASMNIYNSTSGSETRFVLRGNNSTLKLGNGTDVFQINYQFHSSPSPKFLGDGPGNWVILEEQIGRLFIQLKKTPATGLSDSFFPAATGSVTLDNISLETRNGTTFTLTDGDLTYTGTFLVQGVTLTGAGTWRFSTNPQIVGGPGTLAVNASRTFQTDYDVEFTAPVSLANTYVLNKTGDGRLSFPGGLALPTGVPTSNNAQLNIVTGTGGAGSVGDVTITANNVLSADWSTLTVSPPVAGADGVVIEPDAIIGHNANDTTSSMAGLNAASVFFGLGTDFTQNITVGASATTPWKGLSTDTRADRYWSGGTITLAGDAVFQGINGKTLYIGQPGQVPTIDGGNQYGIVMRGSVRIDPSVDLSNITGVSIAPGSEFLITGSIGGDLSLFYSTIKAQGADDIASDYTVGKIKFRGANGAWLTKQGDSGTLSLTTAQLDAATRMSGGTLLVRPSAELGVNEILVNTAAAGNADLVAPFILRTASQADTAAGWAADFLAYDKTGGKGFVTATSTVATDGDDLQSATETTIFDTGAFSQYLPAGTAYAVRALKLGADTGVSGESKDVTTLTLGASGDTEAGIIVNGSSSFDNITLDVGNREAIVYTAAQGGNLLLGSESVVKGTAGLTKFGAGSLSLSGDNSNMGGQFRVQGGSLTLDSPPDAGSVITMGYNTTLYLYGDVDTTWGGLEIDAVPGSVVNLWAPPGSALVTYTFTGTTEIGADQRLNLAFGGAGGSSRNIGIENLVLGSRAYLRVSYNTSLFVTGTYSDQETSVVDFNNYCDVRFEPSTTKTTITGRYLHSNGHGQLVYTRGRDLDFAGYMNRGGDWGKYFSATENAVLTIVSGATLSCYGSNAFLPTYFKGDGLGGTYTSRAVLDAAFVASQESGFGGAVTVDPGAILESRATANFAPIGGFNTSGLTGLVLKGKWEVTTADQTFSRNLQADARLAESGNNAIVETVEDLTVAATTDNGSDNWLRILANRTLEKRGAGYLDLQGRMEAQAGSALLISAGEFRFSHATTDAAPNLTVTLADVAGALLNVNGKNVTIGALAGGGTTGGNVTLGAGTLTISGATTDTFGGTIGGTDADVIALNRLGSGQTELTGINTFVGKTSITGGKIVVSADNGLGAAPADPVADQLSLSDGTLRARDSFTLHANRGVTLSGTAAKIEVDDGKTLAYDGIVAGTALTKQGNGALVLSGASTYRDGTTVSAGTLTVNNSTGSGTGMGAVVVQSGATLKGTGSLAGEVTVKSGATLSPGSSPGTITTGGGLNLNSGSTLNWEHSAGNAIGTPGTGYGQVVVTGGNVVVAAGAKLDLRFAAGTSFSDPFWNTTRTWTLVDNQGGGTLTGTIASGDVTLYVDGTLTTTDEGGFSTQADGGDPNNLVLVWSSSGRDSKLWVGGTEPTLSGETTSTPQDLGRAMLGSAPSASVDLHKTGADATTYSRTVAGNLTAPATASPLLLNAGPQTVPVTVTLATASTGVKTGSVEFDNLATASAGASLGSDNGNATINASGTVLDNRTFSATPATLSLAHVNGTASGSTTVSTTGGNDIRTAVGVPSATDGVATVAGSATVFDTDGESEARAVTTAPLGTPGLYGASVTMTPGIEAGVTGTQTPQTFLVAYNGKVFSGNATWALTGSGAWGSGESANWDDDVTASIHAAPGTFAGFGAADRATFGGGTTAIVSLDGTSPSLNALVLSSGTYTLAQGMGSATLTLAGSGANVTVAAGAQTITAPVTLAANTDFAVTSSLVVGAAIDGIGPLTKSGNGTLILTGANLYGGGTVVSAGTLQIGDGGATGSVAGDISVATALVIDRSGSLACDGAISGVGTVEKKGSGTLALNAGTTHTYGGATTVSAGTLTVNGTLDDQTSAVSVTSGTSAALTGKGIIRRPVLVGNRGVLKAGDGVDRVLQVKSLDMSGGGTFALTPRGTAFGGVTVLSGGSATLADATLDVSAVSAAPAVNEIPLITGASSVTGTFKDGAGDPLPEGSLVDLAGKVFRLTYAGGPSGKDVVLAVPKVAGTVYAIQ